jgi:preprotein translocase subunit SecE
VTIRREGHLAKLDFLKKDNAVFRYFRETWFELRKVSWPTRSEAVNLTLMVIVVTMLLAIILGLMDFVFQSGFSLFL